MLLIRVVLCIFAHTSLIAAQTAGGNFIQPPASPAGGQSAGDYSQDPVYVVGASLNIQWQTDIPNQAVSVGLWQQGVSADQQGTTIVRKLPRFWSGNTTDQRIQRTRRSIALRGMAFRLKT